MQEAELNQKDEDIDRCSRKIKDLESQEYEKNGLLCQKD